MWVGGERWGVRRVGGPKFCAFFSLSPLKIHSFLPSLGVFSWNVALQVARRRKERTCPELVGPRTSRVVLLAGEVENKRSNETCTFVWLLANFFFFFFCDKKLKTTQLKEKFAPPTRTTTGDPSTAPPEQLSQIKGGAIHTLQHLRSRCQRGGKRARTRNPQQVGPPSSPNEEHRTPHSPSVLGRTLRHPLAQHWSWVLLRLFKALRRVTSMANWAPWFRGSPDARTSTLRRRAPTL